MSNSISTKDFLTLLSPERSIRIKDSDISISPLTFKQQRRLVSSGLDGIVGVIEFVKTLNEVLIGNTGIPDLTMLDRVILALELRKSLNPSPIVTTKGEISINSVIDQFKPFDGETETVVEWRGFTVNLKIPTLVEENKILSSCIAELKSFPDDHISSSIQSILIYELMKFIVSISYNDTEVRFASTSVSDRSRIIDNLPADLTNKIADFANIFKKYDESLLNIGDHVIDIDSSFFE